MFLLKPSKNRTFFPVTEAYVGKSKELIICEEEIRKIQEGVLKDPSYAKKVGPHIRLIEATLAKKFKFKEVQLNMYRYDFLSGSSANAFTIINGYSYLDGAKNSEIVVGVNISEKLVVYGELTPGEVLSIILHEIGHNMYKSTFLFAYNVIFNTVSMIIKSILNWGYTIGMGWINDKLRSVDMINKLYADVEKVTKPMVGYLNAFSLLVGLPIAVSNKIMNIIIASSQNPLGFFVEYFAGYDQEKFSDSIANKHGYGPELSTALAKLRVYDSRGGASVKLPPFITLPTDLMHAMLALSIDMLDEHPKNATRTRDMLTSLEKGLNDPELNPKYKKALERDIAALREQVKNYDKIVDNGEWEVFSNAINKTIANNLNGIGDFRDYLIKAPKL